ncbi:muts domain V-domain-containing protein, partial [Piptocephalis cylindrospora]
GQEGYDPRTLLIPQSAWAKFTPFEQQFWEIKCKNYNTVVFFKKGKFYELYEEDADIGHQRFDLKLTDRVNMRMVGVPESGFPYWAGRFVSEGYRVARVEQMETALGMEMRQKGGKEVKKSKVVRRELASILTAGTLTDEGFLKTPESTYCLSIKESGGGKKKKYGVCFVDTSTAEFWMCGFEDDEERTRLETLMTQIQPRELVLEAGKVDPATVKVLRNTLEPRCIWNRLKPSREFWDAEQTWFELTCQGDAMGEEVGGYFGNQGLPEALTSHQDNPVALSALGGLISYLRSLKLDKELLSMGNVQTYGDPLEGSKFLVLDGQTLTNLDIFGKGPGDKISLFRQLNHCMTPFGKRLFRRWVCHPLSRKTEIEERIGAVETLMFCPGGQEFREGLKRTADLERLIARVHAGHCPLKLLLTLLESFTHLSNWMERLLETGMGEGTGLLPRLLATFPSGLGELIHELEGTFDAEAAKAGEVVPLAGVEKDFDRVNEEVEELEIRFQQHLQECRKRLRCPKLQYRNIGREIRQIEVPKSEVGRVPGDWVRQSETKAVSRYWSPEVRGLVRSWEEVQEVRGGVIRELQSRLYARFDAHYRKWSQAVQVIAELDCLWSLAQCSNLMQEPKCKPTFGENKGKAGSGGVETQVEVKELRHPCLSGINSNFIPNDTILGGDDGGEKIILLTGPNMGGKSTLLRQVCLAVVMGQLGCYVPARTCHLAGGPVDRIFTRIGANDNILAGQSTFMVELTETSRILAEATPRSLVILDELGRGTSTFDGYAIAYAVLQYLATFVGCIGLFSTHYSSLVEEIRGHPGIKAQYMSSYVDEERQEVTFLYELVDGKSPSSYGMNVARLAGVSQQVS